jgi:hypothetical protein
MSNSQGNSPAGWYTDPEKGQRRYWDGISWLDVTPDINAEDINTVAAHDKSSTLSIISFVISFIIPFLGVILGVKARRELDRSNSGEGGRALATAAIYVGTIWTIGLLGIAGVIGYQAHQDSQLRKNLVAAISGAMYGESLGKANPNLLYSSIAPRLANTQAGVQPFTNTMAELCSGDLAQVIITNLDIKSVGEGGAQLYPDQGLNYVLFSNACLVAMGWPKQFQQ